MNILRSRMARRESYRDVANKFDPVKFVDPYTAHYFFEFEITTMQSPLSRQLFLYHLPFYMWPFTAKAGNELKVGDTAPAFELIDQYQKVHTLADYAGKWVVVYFYPKDDTPGCTTEACNFRDDIFTIHELNAEVLGISLDSAESHAKFAGKHGLPFPLLSDADKKTAEKYGCLTSLGPVKFARRHTFIINPEGKLAKIYRDVKPKRHSRDVITDLRSLQKL